MIHVTPLLRELVLETVRFGMLRDGCPEQERLTGVVFDQIGRSPQAPLRLDWPSDPRARRVAERVSANLASTTPIADLADGGGASVRTIERLFVEQTALTFGRWRQRAKVLGALERLAAGDSVTTAGLAVGYDTTSAFIAMFKRVLGGTPGNYFARPPKSEPGPGVA